MRVPGVCIVCLQPVVWNGIAWRRPSGGANHACPVERPECGAVMPGRGNWRTRGGEPGPRERCARKPGHRDEHRTAYSLANASLRGWDRPRRGTFVDAKRAGAWTIRP